MAPPGVLLMHPASVEHETGAHPEHPDRMASIERALEAAEWCGFERALSPPCSVEALQAVHPGRYVTMIRELAESGGGRVDADTIVSPGSWEAALHASGGAVELVRRVVSGEAPTGFSIHRPPGHHAEPGRAMGFCLLNNVAVAARSAIDSLGLERVMIVDYDVHHGNGTNAVFHEDPSVLFVSIHQSPLYPGTGPLTDVGHGPGEGYSVNLPVPPGSGDAIFCGLVEGIAVPLARAFTPQLILISAGFDAAAADPLADCLVTERGFARMTAALQAVAGELGAPVAAVLEGGYSLAALGGCVVAATRALAGAPAGAAQELAGERAGAEPAAAIIEPARARLAPWWPALAD